jgi:hypothetical protein
MDKHILADVSAVKVIPRKLAAKKITSDATNIGIVAGAVWFVYGLLMKGVGRMGSIQR